jgi:hypothetical protein
MGPGGFVVLNEEQRRTPRIQPYVVPCRVLDSARRSAGYIVDLSTTGARITIDAEPPNSGTNIILQIHFAVGAPFASRPPCAFPAQVRWIKGPESPDGAFTFGVSFEGLGSGAQDALNAAIAEFGTRRRAGITGDHRPA